MKVIKKPGRWVEAVQLKGKGQIQTDRGEILDFVPGDWLMTSQDGQQWPISDEYFKANYDEVSDV